MIFIQFNSLNYIV